MSLPYAGWQILPACLNFVITIMVYDSPDDPENYLHFLRFEFNYQKTIFVKLKFF